MKKIIFIGLILCVVIASGCKKSTKDLLSGTWKLTAVEGQKLTLEDLKTTMTFTDDKFNMKIAGDKERAGTWELSADEKTITAKNTEGDKETWNIVKLDDKEYIFTVDKDKEKISMAR
jgi:uncharacterized protein (TIGR03067 family)